MQCHALTTQDRISNNYVIYPDECDDVEGFPIEEAHLCRFQMTPMHPPSSHEGALVDADMSSHTQSENSEKQFEAHRKFIN